MLDIADAKLIHIVWYEEGGKEREVGFCCSDADLIADEAIDFIAKRDIYGAGLLGASDDIVEALARVLLKGHAYPEWDCDRWSVEWNTKQDGWRYSELIDLKDTEAFRDACRGSIGDGFTYNGNDPSPAGKLPEEAYV